MHVCIIYAYVATKMLRILQESICYNYASVGGATRHTVVRLFVCLSFRLFLQFCGAR